MFTQTQVREHIYGFSWIAARTSPLWCLMLKRKVKSLPIQVGHQPTMRDQHVFTVLSLRFGCLTLCVTFGGFAVLVYSYLCQTAVSYLADEFHQSSDVEACHCLHSASLSLLVVRWPRKRLKTHLFSPCSARTATSHFGHYNRTLFPSHFNTSVPMKDCLTWRVLSNLVDNLVS